MKKILSLLALSLFVINLAAVKPKNKLKFTSGTYGVCSCAGSNENSNKLELTLNDDHTFHYINTTNTSKPVNVKGTWEQKGNKVVLKNLSEGSSMATTWKIDGSFNCLKSRKGLCWTRICHLNDCK